jgi:hypothetical protein
MAGVTLAAWLFVSWYIKNHVLLIPADAPEVSHDDDGD